ncbi:MAG: hypothetical protein K9G44_14340 [Melioribacteraceae bacterium]|nr:hypothetical protein [Melioribacteraceae bacterium]
MDFVDAEVIYKLQKMNVTGAFIVNFIKQLKSIYSLNGEINFAEVYSTMHQLESIEKKRVNSLSNEVGF